MKDVPGKSSEFQKTVRGLYQLMSFAGIEGTGALLTGIVFPLEMPKIFRLYAVFRYFFTSGGRKCHPTQTEDIFLWKIIPCHLSCSIRCWCRFRRQNGHQPGSRGNSLPAGIQGAGLFAPAPGALHQRSKTARKSMDV